MSYSCSLTSQGESPWWHDTLSLSTPPRLSRLCIVSAPPSSAQGEMSQHTFSLHTGFCSLSFLCTYIISLWSNALIWAIFAAIWRLTTIDSSCIKLHHLICIHYWGQFCTMNAGSIIIRVQWQWIWWCMLIDHSLLTWILWFCVVAVMWVSDDITMH